MKTKNIYLLILVMLISLLTGCVRKEVSVEDLINQAIDTDYVAYELEYCIDYSDEIDGLKDRVEYKVSSSIERSKKVCYQDIFIDAEYSMETYSYMRSLEVYSELNKKEETLYVNLDENWENSNYDVTYDSYIPKLEADMFNDLELEETDDGYKVTGKIEDLEVIKSFDNMILSDAVSDIKEVDGEVILFFNKDKELESIKVQIETDEDEKYETDTFGSVNIYGITVEIKFKSFEGDEVEIPKEVTVGNLE